MVIRVVLASALRPAAGEASTTRLAAHEGAQREVRVRALLWRGALNSPRQDRLDAEEQVLGDQGLEVAAFSANAVLGDVHDAGVKPISQQRPNRLGRQRTIAAVRQAPNARLLEDLLLGETPCGVLREYAAHNRRAFRVWQQALANRARRIQIAEWCQEHPTPELQCRFHAGPGPV